MYNIYKKYKYNDPILQLHIKQPSKLLSSQNCISRLFQILSVLLLPTPVNIKTKNMLHPLGLSI